eukprot:Gb_16795 [translate_table: standard]
MRPRYSFNVGTSGSAHESGKLPSKSILRRFTIRLWNAHKLAAKEGYRLATVHEASKNLAKIKELFVEAKGHMQHLLNGWISMDDEPTEGYTELDWDWWLVVKIGKISIGEMYSELSPEEKEEALFFFSRDGNTDLVELLLKAIGKVPHWHENDGNYVEFRRTHDRMTPLHLAVYAQSEETVKVILRYCPDEGIMKHLIARSDALGMTALLEAVKRADEGIVKELLRNGAQPIEERDIDKKTALHYAVCLRDDSLAEHFAKLLLSECYSEKCKSLRDDQQEDKCICKSLLLWAKASGIGTAQESAKSRGASKVFHYLWRQMMKWNNENLLRTAAKLKNYGMIRELLNRGFILDVADYPKDDDREYKIKGAISKVQEEIDLISRSAADTPAAEDSLGRRDFVKGLAALFLNPYVASPVVEHILLRAAAQLVFPNLWYAVEADTPSGLTMKKLSPKGQILYKSTKEEANRLLGHKRETALYKRMEKEAKMFLDSSKEHKEPIHLDPVQCLLGAEYRVEFENVYKSLAVMDRNMMIKTVEDNQRSSRFTPLQKAWQCILKFLMPTKDASTRSTSRSSRQPVPPSQRNDQSLRESPGILTVRYNAWRYRTESEAWAGLAVEITKEIEARMTRAQQLATSWTYFWKRNKSSIWLQLILPFLFVITLTPWISWVVWVLFIGIVKPISDQMAGYLAQSPGHEDKLGYHENVITDIKFLMEEIGNEPSWLWRSTARCFYGKSVRQMPSLEFIKPASKDKLRVIVFVDDLDRCSDSVILEVLSAINLVLAACEINVVLGTDKSMIVRALKSSFITKTTSDDRTPKMYEDKELEMLGDKYLRKIIQLPLDLPDPSSDELKNFLDTQLGARSKVNGQQQVPLGNDQPPPNESTRGNVSSAYHEPDPSLHQAFSETDPSFSDNHDLEIGSFRDEGPTQDIKLNVLIRGVTLIPEYTRSERLAFQKLSKLVTRSEMNPREWKRLLVYHRLAWNILSQRDDVTRLTGWQLQLVMWIFVCWRWRDEMDRIIKNWHNYVDVRTHSLRDIVHRRIISKKNKDKKRQSQSPTPETDAGKGGAPEEKDLQLEKNTHREELEKLHKALEKGEDNVWKEAIIHFQAFRFYCKPTFLSFPEDTSSNPSNEKQRKGEELSNSNIASSM